MVDFRSIQSIAERSEVYWEHFPNRMLRWRRFATAAAGIVTLLAVAGHYGLTRDNRVFQARPVAASHQAFANRCSECHDQHWQPLLRLANPHATSTSAEACRKCHIEHQHDHHPSTMVTSDVAHCAECHREHRSAGALTNFSDSQCTRCHRDLRTREGAPSFASQIGDLAAHPEFAVRRLSDAGVAPQHEVRRRAAPPLAGADPPSPWTDRVNLRFSHQRHLDPRGVPTPSAGGAPRFEQLNCGSCHQPEADGESMRPIAFEQHCVRCHQLDFAEPLVAGGPGGENRIRQLPHESPDLLRGLLRDRLTAYVNRHPEVAAPPANAPLDRPAALPPVRDNANDNDNDNAPTPETPRKPGTPQEEDQRDAARWRYVERQLGSLEQTVNGQPPRESGASRLDRIIGQGCQFCHIADDSPNAAYSAGAADSGAAPWRLLPTRIPAKWLPYSRFRHDAHTMWRCVECHYKERGAETPTDQEVVAWHSRDDRSLPPSATIARSIFASDRAADILLPSMDTCRQCHGSGAAQALGGAASGQCVECHRYHQRQFGDTPAITWDGFEPRSWSEFAAPHATAP